LPKVHAPGMAEAAKAVVGGSAEAGSAGGATAAANNVSERNREG
jgi:hypothetical protein